MLQFEDLDELHAAFVEPLVSKVQSVTTHRKFRDDIKSKIDEQVREQGGKEGREEGGKCRSLRRTASSGTTSSPRSMSR